MCVSQQSGPLKWLVVLDLPSCGTGPADDSNPFWSSQHPYIHRELCTLTRVIPLGSCSSTKPSTTGTYNCFLDGEGIQSTPLAGRNPPAPYFDPTPSSNQQDRPGYTKAITVGDLG